MPRAGFEPAIPVTKRLQTCALDRAASARRVCTLFRCYSQEQIDKFEKKNFFFFFVCLKVTAETFGPISMKLGIVGLH
jgi:S-adenosylmethionine:tRNA-ribosyltransferase-isomerase (queuine synthetase)